MHYAWITQPKISLTFYLKYINFSTPNLKKITFGVLSREVNEQFQTKLKLFKKFTKTTCKNLESHISLISLYNFSKKIYTNNVIHGWHKVKTIVLWIYRSLGSSGR